MALDRSNPVPNDLSAFWMPFTANRQFKKNPRMFVEAEGMFYKTADGRDVLDGTAGLWCCNAGHKRPKIVEAIRRLEEGAIGRAYYAQCYYQNKRESIGRGKPKPFTLPPEKLREVGLVPETWKQAGSGMPQSG